MSSTRRGRPALAWLSADALATLPVGTAISVELVGKHTARLVGRITAQLDGALDLWAPASGDIGIRAISVKRARILDALYEPGDAVLLRHVPASTWRGGVVRADAERILVEQIDGSFAWFDEGDLEPAEARQPAAPTLPRGPVPARS